MAYLVEHDRLRAILPEGFTSLRPVLRINAEIREDLTSYLEFNTAVEKDSIRGWLNIAHWDHIPFQLDDQTVTFQNKSFRISFKRVGIQGDCPAERDNDGCFFLEQDLQRDLQFRPNETITGNKEFCDCEFSWLFAENGAHGVSIGKTLPAVPAEIQNQYPKMEFTLEHAATIPCEQVLGTYAVTFDRASL